MKELKAATAVITVLAVAVLAGCLLDGTLNGNGQPLTEVQAYFTYPGTTRPEDDDVENVLVSTIGALGEGDGIDIALYSFTDDQIGEAVLTAWRNGADVRIFQEEDRTCRRGAEAARLAGAGIPYRVDDHSGLMHHKFAVINAVKVLTGSYNWSDAADTRNYENIVVIENREVARDYRENFDLMWANGMPFTGCSN